MMKQTFQHWMAYKIPTNHTKLLKGTHVSSSTYNYNVGQLMKLNIVRKSQHYNEVVPFLQLFYIGHTNLLLLNFSTCLNSFSFFFIQDPQRNKHYIWRTLVMLLSSASHWGEKVGPDQQISLPSKTKKGNNISIIYWFLCFVLFFSVSLWFS